jgi:ATP-dependent DNA ligase
MQKRRQEEAEDAQFDETDVVNLIVNDLLWLDGQWLLDVPLLERKRVLESILPPGQLVRPGPFVRMPIDSWIGSWRAQGFRGMAFKAANSRYRPGETAADWTLADLPRR